jgi:hypothetical protein
MNINRRSIILGLSSLPALLFPWRKAAAEPIGDRDWKYYFCGGSPLQPLNEIKIDGNEISLRCHESDKIHPFKDIVASLNGMKNGWCITLLETTAPESGIPPIWETVHWIVTGKTPIQLLGTKIEIVADRILCHEAKHTTENFK